jgi:hypothetical protein
MTTTTVLHECLQRGTLVLFLGADLPQSVTGVPSRAALARALAQRHGLEAGTSLARVAQQVGRGGWRREFTVFLREQVAGAQSQTFHRRVVDFVREHGIKTLITTAYDDLLQRAFSAANVPVEVVWKDSQLDVAFPDRPLLIQLYGNPLTDVESLVVTEDDHLDLWRDRRRESVLDEVKRTLQRNTVLFLGYDLSDPDFLLLWREVLSRAGDLHRRAFAVWPGLPEAEVGVWADRGIVIVEKEPWGLLGEKCKTEKLQIRVEANGQMTVPLPNAMGEMKDTPISPVTTFPEEALQKAVEENPPMPHVKFELLFNGSLTQLHSLVRSLQGKLCDEYERRHPEDLFNPKIAYEWRGMESDVFRITLIDLRTDEPCGNVSAYSIPKGARLEVWHQDNAYAQSVWERLHAEMEKWGFVDTKAAVAPLATNALSSEPPALKMARRALNILEERAAGFGKLHLPTHLQIELEEKRREVAALEVQYGITQTVQVQTLHQESKSLSTVLKVYAENEGRPHQPREGGQWFSRLAIESLQPLQKCEARIHRIRRLDDPSVSEGKPLPAFTPSYLSWAREKGLFGKIDLKPGKEEHLDLAWHARGDPPMADDELRVASSLDSDRERDTTSEDWGMRQDFISLKPGYYLFTIRIFAEGYDDWFEGEYQLYWPGIGQESDIHLVECGKAQEIKGLDPHMGMEKIYHGIGKAWAVLVGVNQYSDPFIASLKVCVDDVTAVQEALAGRYQAARLLTDATQEKPTRANILAELSTVAQAAEADDLLLFYFSGHGKAEGGESYLFARDTRLAALKHTALAMADVHEIITQSPAHAKIVILDACHSGAAIGKSEPTMTPEFIQRVFEEAEGMAVLASCKQGQQSWEWPEQQRSVFTYYLLEALTGKADLDDKGFVTVSDASRHVTDGVKAWAIERGVPQTPTLQYTVAGDIILLRYGAT